MMAFRFALLLFTSGLGLITGPPASAWIKPCGGAPHTRKSIKETVNAPLLDQLLNSLNQVGCTKISSLAKAAVKTPSPSLKSFAAKVGGSHVERSLQTWAHKQSWIDFLPDPFDFNIHVEDLGCNREGVFEQKAGSTTAKHSCILPHEVIGSLWDKAPDVFEHLLGDANTLKAFWQAAATANDEWYREHPVLLGGAPPEVCIPIGLHGDDAGVHGQEQVLVITWNAVTYILPTLDSRIVFTMLKVSTIHPFTMKRIYDVLVWSFDALAKGKFPAADPWGTEFSSTYMPERARKAGKALAKRADGALYRGLFAEFRGDWKYLKEAFCLADSYCSADFICHKCNARKLGIKQSMWYSNFCRNAEHRNTMVSNSEFINRYRWVSPLVLIVGFHITRIVYDKMHCMDLGVLQLLLPSCMHMLLARPSPRYPELDIDARYGHAYKNYRFWSKGPYRDKQPTIVKKKFGSKSWGASTEKYAKIGQLVAKASAIRNLQYWVEYELKLDLAAGTPAAAMTADQLRLKTLQRNCIHGFCEADRICRRAGRYFTAEQHAEFCGWLEVGLRSANELAAVALMKKWKLYKLIPKFHALTHYYDTRLNPRRVTCYQDEDMVGRMKKIYVRCHGKTAPRASLQRYRVMIGIRWNDFMAQLRGV